MSATAARAPSARSSRMPWLARSRREPHLPLDPCRNPECDGRPVTAFDLFCEGENEHHFLPLAHWHAARIGMLLASAGSVAAAIAMAAAVADTPVPLYIGAVVLGVALLTTSLHAFEESRIVAPTVWIAACAIAAAWREDLLAGAAGRDAAIAVATLVLATLVLATSTYEPETEPEADLEAEERDDDVETEKRVDDPAIQGLAALFTVTVSCALLALVFAAGVGGVNAKVEVWLLLAALTTVVVACVVAIMVGSRRASLEHRFEHRFHRSDRWTVPERNVPRASASPATGSGPFGRSAQIVASSGFELRRILIKAMNAGVGLLWRLANDAFDALRWAGSLMTAIAKWIWYVLKATAAAARDALEAAATLAVAIARYWAESTLLGLALFGCAGLAAITAAGLFADYLAHGPLWNGPASVGLIVIAAVALLAVSWPLTKQPFAEIAEAAQRTVERAMAPLLLMAVAIGWIDGGLGLAGIGPMRPGPLTIGGTLVIAAFMWWARSHDGVDAARGA
jgi:hypothetical protein